VPMIATLEKHLGETIPVDLETDEATKFFEE
jgi:hypothetical protein